MNSWTSIINVGYPPAAYTYCHQEAPRRAILGLNTTTSIRIMAEHRYLRCFFGFCLLFREIGRGQELDIRVYYCSRVFIQYRGEFTCFHFRQTPRMCETLNVSPMSRQSPLQIISLFCFSERIIRPCLMSRMGLLIEAIEARTHAR